MNYVEWLRVRNITRVVAIVLGALLVLGLGARIWLAMEFGSDQNFVDRIQKDPGTATSQTTFNGRPRTVIVNAREHVRVTIDDRADGGRTITVTEPKSNGDDIGDLNVHSMGSISVSTTTGPLTRTTVVDTNDAVPLEFYLAFGYIVALIVATAYGASFAKENNGHLEIAFLRPVSRERLALSVIAADCAGILIAEILTVIAVVIGQTFFEFPHFRLTGIDANFVLAIVIVPLAWYLFLNAASASLKRGSGAIIGFSWPVAAVLIALGSADLGGTSLGRAVHAISWTLSRFIPLTYGSFDGKNGDLVLRATHLDALIPVTLLVVYGVLAIAQWRRVEA
jgi:hypothetical protein